MPKKTLKEAAAPAPAPDDIAALSFEQAYAELDVIVAKLEDGELSLEDSLALHARGQQLAAHCSRQLEAAELKVRDIKDE
jgi:exodeoxyribonuclease VII small subunit